MYGYTFAVTNNKTGETYIGKRYAVAFDNKYFGEDENEELSKAIEKDGKASFSVKMIMPYETKEAVDYAFNEIKPPEKIKRKRAETVKDDVLDVTVIEPEKKAPARKRSTKKA